MRYETDVERLRSLIGMLPSGDDEDFWAAVAAANGESVEYVLSKMAYCCVFAEGGAPAGFGSMPPGEACEYLIMFFGGDKSAVWDKLSGRVFSHPPSQSTIGRHMAQDITDTAWRVLVGSGYRSDPTRITRWAFLRR